MARVSQGHVEFDSVTDDGTRALVLDALQSSDHPITADEDGEQVVIYREYE